MCLLSWGKTHPTFLLQLITLTVAFFDSEDFVAVLYSHSRGCLASKITKNDYGGVVLGHVPRLPSLGLMRCPSDMALVTPAATRQSTNGTIPFRPARSCSILVNVHSSSTLVHKPFAHFNRSPDFVHFASMLLHLVRLPKTSLCVHTI